MSTRIRFENGALKKEGKAEKINKNIKTNLRKRKCVMSPPNSSTTEIVHENIAVSENDDTQTNTFHFTSYSTMEIVEDKDRKKIAQRVT
jgi:hypothetical protein